MSSPVRLETKYMIFTLVERKPKTNVWAITSKSSGDLLATIKWYGPWHQYVLYF